ncbi:hypothetical protein ACFE04_008879 [Oxalis oulophora]
MGYLSSCNAESAIATCDPYNWSALKRKPNSINNKPIKIIREFSYNDLVTATNNFSVDCFLGKGSQGSVYKAILDNGKLIAAVKKTTQYSKNSNNTLLTPTPTENEVDILSRVHNPRLVNLIGFCNTHSSNLIVVEYMPNGSLYDLLHSNSINNNKLPGWTKRVGFALQVAKAIHYLHSANTPVIHRDIKSSNVLIDTNRKARLGDFGLSLRGHVEDVRIKCTPPAGTLGYLDPSYIVPADVSTKSDVFSFGILLLEIISGRHALDLNYSPPSIVDWAIPLIKRSDFAGICDPRLGTPADFAVVGKLGLLAVRCVRTRAEKRPDMGEVVECLKSVSNRMKSSVPLIWNSCKQHVTCVEQSQPLIAYTSIDGSDDEGVRVSNSGYKRIGSRKNRKVSNVSSGEYGKGGDRDLAVDHLMGENRVVRSRSVDSCSEVIYTRMIVKNKITAVNVNVRLSKSRSMGVLLQSPKVIDNLNI